MKRIGIIILVWCCFCISLLAIQADNKPFTIVEPDGHKVEVYLQGDAFYSYYILKDGMLVDKGSDGYLYFARMLKNGKIKRSSLRASTPLSQTQKKSFQTMNQLSEMAKENHQKMLLKNERRYAKGPRGQRLFKRAPGSCASSFPTQGQPKSLVILVEYKDVKFSVKPTKESFTRLLNEENYSDNNAIGSARDYFKACSNNTFVPNFDVYGPYTLPNNRIYYGKRVSADETDERPHHMIRDALIAADKDINYQDYDVNKDGKIDNVFVYYAGHNEAERGPSESVWPHRHALYDMTVKLDGVQAYDYACTSELTGNEGNTMCGMATFSHEFGHVLGLVDYYATDYSHQNVPGSWNIMSRGNYNGDGRTPPTYSAQDRFYLGWITPRQIMGPEVVDLAPLATDNEALLLAVQNSNLNGKSPNPLEYFLLENRQHVGWDTSPSCIPGHGLLISHVDFDALNWKLNKPNNHKDDLGYEIVRADQSLLNEAGDVFPGTQNVTLCNPILKNGIELGLPLTQIEEKYNHIHCLIKGGDGRGLHANMYSMWFDSHYMLEPTEKLDTICLQLELYGKKLSEAVEIFTLKNIGFQFGTDKNSLDFSKVIIPLEKDSIESTLFVKYVPVSPYRDKESNDALIVKSGDYQIRIPLNASLHKERNLSAPRLKKETAVGGQTLTVNWEKQKEASTYRINVFKTVGGDASYTQNFERFGTPAFSEQTNWLASFTNFTADKIPSYPRAPRFCNKGEWLQSEIYPSVITQLSFWLMPQSVQGDMQIEAYDGTKWETIILTIDWNLKTGKVYTVTFDSSKGYRAFRWTYTGEGCCVLDNVVASTRNAGEKVVDNKICTPNYLIVGGLDIQTDYTYYIESNYVLNGIHYYSQPSFVGSVTTADKSIFGKDAMPIIYDESLQRYIVYIPKVEKDKLLYIYDISGHLIGRIKPDSEQVILPEMTKNQVYILIYCEPNKRVMSTDLRTKFVYN